MFCPKCGTQNPETGKFCRSCGTDLGNVSAVLSGNLPPAVTDHGAIHLHNEAKRRSDPNEVYGDSVKAILSGLGFLIVAVVLAVTNVAAGRVWWWAMLFPAFSFLAKGVADHMKYRKMSAALSPATQSMADQLRDAGNSQLSAGQTDYVSPSSAYKTGELVPPSVTEGTTRHLERDSEGETMMLPKK